MYQTSSNRSDEEVTESESEGRSLVGGRQEWKPLGDQQVAAIIMLMFIVGAIIIAIILQNLVS